MQRLISLFVLIALILSAAPARLLASEAMPGKPGTYLFIDDYLIDKAEGLTRTQHSPERRPEPIVGTEHKPWQPWMTVIHDKEKQVFRLWYNSWVSDEDTMSCWISYLESKDGIHWPGPRKDLFKFEGFGASVIDEGPAFKPANQRYKLAWWERHQKEEGKSGMYLATSPDGLDWKPLSNNPVVVTINEAFTRQAFEEKDPEKIKKYAEMRRGSIHDIINLYQDPILGGYTVLAKMFSASTDEFGKTSRTFERGIRLIGQTHSEDFVRWTPIERVVIPDDRDPGITEFYGMTPKPYSTFILSFVKVLRDDLAADDQTGVQGIGYMTLAISHDGKTWERFREPFFDRRAGDPNAFDHAHAWIDSIIDVGDETWFYYAGYKRGHKVERFKERLIGLAKLRKDGYVSRDAGETTGTLLTKPISLKNAKAISINADDSKGWLRVRMLDEKGKLLGEFNRIPDNSVEQNSVLPEKLADRAKPVRLEFTMRNAKLYGFTLK